MKKLSVLSLVLALAISLTGCVGGELKLYNAMIKMENVNAMESQVQIGFTFDTEGFSPEEQEMFAQAKAIVNSSKLKVNNKIKSNEENTISKNHLDMNLNLGGISLDMSAWTDMDLSADDLKMKQVFKMPPILMTNIDPTKEYLTFDMAQFLKEESSGLDLTQVMKFSNDKQRKMIEFMDVLKDDFNSGIKLVESKGSRVINNEKLDIYELKLTDDTFKKFTEYAVNYFLESEAVAEFIEEYILAFIDAYSAPEEEKEAMRLEFEQEFRNQLSEMKVEFNEFMKKYKDVQIVGDKGIVIEYGINKDGYIVHEKAALDFKIDLAKIAKAEGEEDTETKGIIKFGINYTVKNSNINNKNLKVSIPSTNKENSLDYNDMINSYRYYDYEYDDFYDYIEEDIYE